MFKKAAVDLLRIVGSFILAYMFFTTLLSIIPAISNLLNTTSLVDAISTFLTLNISIPLFIHVFLKPKQDELELAKKVLIIFAISLLNFVNIAVTFNMAGIVILFAVNLIMAAITELIRRYRLYN